MTFVVTENCIKCKYTDCVDVCPVDCFHEGPNFLVIDPEECIDCTLCEPECPAEAIFSEDDLPEEQNEFIQINEELSKVWPVLAEKKDQLEDAEDWDGKTGKKLLFKQLSVLTSSWHYFQFGEYAQQTLDIALLEYAKSFYPLHLTSVC